jgi:hypothetical protein
MSKNGVRQKRGGEAVTGRKKKQKSKERMVAGRRLEKRH